MNRDREVVQDPGTPGTQDVHLSRCPRSNGVRNRPAAGGEPRPSHLPVRRWCGGWHQAWHRRPLPVGNGEVWGTGHPRAVRAGGKLGDQ